MSSITKNGLIEALFEKVGLNKRESKKIVEIFFEEIIRALERGDDVQLVNFGNFELLDKKERPGRNPRTNEVVVVSPRRVVTFHASQSLKQKVEAKLHTKAQNNYNINNK